MFKLYVIAAIFILVIPLAIAGLAIKFWYVTLAIIAVGVWLIIRARRRRRPAVNPETQRAIELQKARGNVMAAHASVDAAKAARDAKVQADLAEAMVANEEAQRELRQSLVEVEEARAAVAAAKAARDAEQTT